MPLWLFLREKIRNYFGAWLILTLCAPQISWRTEGGHITNHLHWWRLFLGTGVFVKLRGLNVGSGTLPAAKSASPAGACAWRTGTVESSDRGTTDDIQS
jgi:hypothetical protein